MLKKLYGAIAITTIISLGFIPIYAANPLENNSISVEADGVTYEVPEGLQI